MNCARRRLHWRWFADHSGRPLNSDFVEHFELTAKPVGRCGDSRPRRLRLLRNDGHLPLAQLRQMSSNEDLIMTEQEKTSKLLHKINFHRTVVI